MEMHSRERAGSMELWAGVFEQVQQWKSQPAPPTPPSPPMDPISRPSRIWKWLAVTFLLYAAFCTVVAYYSLREDWRPSGMLFGLLGRYSWVACAVAGFVSALVAATFAVVSVPSTELSLGARPWRTWNELLRSRIFRRVVIAGGLFLGLVGIWRLNLPDLLLSRAAAAGDIPSAYWALALGADGSGTKEAGPRWLKSDAITLAAGGGHATMVEWLMDQPRGGDPSYNALSSAMQGEHWDVAELLIERGIAPLVNDLPLLVAKAPDQLFDVSLEKIEIERGSGVHTETVCAAARRGDKELLTALVEAGIRLEGDRGILGPTPMDILLEERNEQARALLRSVGGRHRVFGVVGGKKPVGHTVFDEDAGAIADRLRMGTLQGPRLQEELTRAITLHHATVVELLLDAGADPNLKEKYGWDAARQAENALRQAEAEHRRFDSLPKDSYKSLRAKSQELYQNAQRIVELMDAYRDDSQN